MGYAAIGASGAVSAIVFIFILMYPWLKLSIMFILPMPAIVAGLGYIAYSWWAANPQSPRTPGETCGSRCPPGGFPVWDPGYIDPPALGNSRLFRTDHPTVWLGSGAPLLSSFLWHSAHAHGVLRRLRRLRHGQCARPTSTHSKPSAKRVGISKCWLGHGHWMCRSH